MNLEFISIIKERRLLMILILKTHELFSLTLKRVNNNLAFNKKNSLIVSVES